MNSISFHEFKNKSGFVGQFEAELFAQNQNNIVRAQRIQQIRKQENDMIKQKIQKKQQISQKQLEEEQRNLKYQEYLKKKAEIEALEQARQQSIQQQELQRKNAEQYQLREQELQRQKQAMQQQFNEQAELRYQIASEWKKKSYLETDWGKAQTLANFKKEASIIEKQKEAQSIALYKEQSKNKSSSTYLQDLENYEKFDKNISRRQILKPEDFANTCFHNPKVVKHDFETEKENAIEKANQTIIETQAMLLEQAKIKREQERIQKQRSIIALSKEREAKVLEQLEEEVKFIKKQEIVQLQKTKPPVRKPKSEKNHQKMLSNEFDKIFNCNSSGIEVREHRRKSTSPKNIKQHQNEQNRPKSVKIFTKPPLDTNLFSNPQKESMEKEDYIKYALGGSEDQNGSQKKKVQFSEEKMLTDRKNQSENDNITKNVDFLQDNESNNHSEFEQGSSISSDQELSKKEDEQQTIAQSNQLNDLKKYIKDQENYLQELEQQRIDNKTKIRQGEQKLVQSLKNTRKQYSKQPIPEESEGESSYQKSSSVENESYEEQSDMKQNLNNKNFNESNNDEQQRPEIEYKYQQYETIDGQFNTQDLMQQFLQPKKGQNLLCNKQLSLIPEYQSNSKQSANNQQNQVQFQTQFQFNSPNSDLNYSLSEVKNVTSPIKKCEQLQQIASPGQESSQKKNSIDSEQLKYSLQQSSEQLQDLVQQEYEETLGEIFQKRKAMLAKKMESRQDQKIQEKQGKTKEELIQIRKEMLKSKRQIEKEIQDKNNESDEKEEQDLKSVDQIEDKRSQLMKRLASGEKVKVDKKEMIGLTNKNYEQLPEVKKKKDEQEKTESLKQRKQKVKEMDQKLRETMKQKRQQGC